MNEARKKELIKIKDEQKKTIAEIQQKISQLEKALRVAVDKHNQAAWILEEYEKMEKPKTQTEKELTENQGKKNV